MISDRYNNDPYTLSSRVRRKFREEKKIDKAIKVKDDEVKRRYGLPETLSLIREDTQLQDEAKEQFRNARQKSQLEGGGRSSRPASSAKAALTASLTRHSSMRKLDATGNGNYNRIMHTKGSDLGVSIRK